MRRSHRLASTALACAMSLQPAWAAEAPVAAACRKDFSFDGALASYGKTWTKSGLERWDEFLFDVIMYRVCVGRALDRSDSCADPASFWDVLDGERGRPGMTPVPAGRTVRRLCRDQDNEAMNIRAFARGPKGFLEACRGGLETDIPAEKRGDVCPKIAERFDEPRAAALVAARELGVVDQTQVDHIIHDVMVTSGLIASKDCGNPDPFKVEACVASYAFRQKRLGGRPDCGSNGFCRMLIGGGAPACEPYALKARDLFCAKR